MCLLCLYCLQSLYVLALFISTEWFAFFVAIFVYWQGYRSFLLLFESFICGLCFACRSLSLAHFMRSMYVAMSKKAIQARVYRVYSSSFACAICLVFSMFWTSKVMSTLEAC